MRFTDRNIKALKPRDKRYDVFEDGRIRALAFACRRPAGSRGFSSIAEMESSRG
ncbi:MAG: hypothetical protein O6950_08720 [Gammaproteobacteria bacterium]|nr:hypothetical protein [Gammaproteobacteria bacterium]